MNSSIELENIKDLYIYDYKFKGNHTIGDIINDISENYYIDGCSYIIRTRYNSYDGLSINILINEELIAYGMYNFINGNLIMNSNILDTYMIPIFQYIIKTIENKGITSLDIKPDIKSIIRRRNISKL